LEPRLANEESTDIEQSEVTEASATGKIEKKMADLTNMFGARKDKVQVCLTSFSMDLFSMDLFALNKL
jgi:hypothetical protein